MPAAPEVTQSRPAGTGGAPETTPSGILTYLADMRRLAAVESRRAAQRRLGKWQQGGSAELDPLTARWSYGKVFASSGIWIGVDGGWGSRSTPFAP